jgi:hypothetical protein
MKRMVIERYVPPAPPETDGLPPLPSLPPRDGTIPTKLIGKRIYVDAWARDSINSFAKGYARTCCAALDVEIDVLKTERDGLKAELERLRESL